MDSRQLQRSFWYTQGRTHPRNWFVFACLLRIYIIHLPSDYRTTSEIEVSFGRFLEYGPVTDRNWSILNHPIRHTAMPKFTE